MKHGILSALILIAGLAVATPGYAQGQGLSECAWPACSGGGSGSGGIDIDGDGLVDCIDTNKDKACEEGWPFDADGDGSSPKVLCTGVGLPLPSCLFAGDVINEDYADDTNCFLPKVDGSPKGAAERCDGTNGYRLAMGAIYHLPAAVRQIRFPCWDHTAWTGDSSTPSGTSDPTVANDPRDPATHDAITDKAWDHCPLDEWGEHLYAIAWGSWDGTVLGGGTDTRTNQQMILEKTLIGSYVADDRGNNEDGRWFNSATFILGERVGWSASNCVGGGCVSPSGASLMHDNRYSSTLGQCVGVGAIQDTPGIGLTGARDDWTDISQSGYMCVCNSRDNDCGIQPESAIIGNASTNDWTECLLADQRLTLIAPYRLGSTNIVQIELTSARDGADYKIGVCTTGAVGTLYTPCASDADCGGSTCSMCGDPDEIMIQFGDMQLIEETGSADGWRQRQGVGGIDGKLDCSAQTCAVFAPPAEFFNGGVTIKNVTYTANDTWNTIGDLCDDTFTSEQEFHDPISGSTDDDCDTHPFIFLTSGKDVTLENMVIKHWGHFATDMGSAHMGTVLFKDNLWIHGFGQAIGDFGWGMKAVGNRIANSIFRNTVIGTFGPTQWWEKTLIESVSIFPGGGFINMANQYNTTIIDTHFIGVSAAGSLFVLQNGARHNTIRNVYVEGASVSSGNTVNQVVSFVWSSGNNDLYGNTVDTVTITGAGMPSSGAGQFPLITMADDGQAFGTGIYGNTITNIRSHHQDDDACLIAKTAADDGAPDRVFEKNTFSNLHAGAGRVFCRALGGDARFDPDDGTVPNVHGAVANGFHMPDPIVHCRTLLIDGNGNTDNNLFFSGDYDYRIQNAWCQMAGAQAQAATLIFEDDSNNVVAGTVTCTDPGSAPTHTIMTGTNSLSAGESLRFDNDTAPTATVEVMVCADIIAEWK